MLVPKGLPPVLVNNECGVHTMSWISAYVFCDKDEAPSAIQYTTRKGMGVIPRGDINVAEH